MKKDELKMLIDAMIQDNRYNAKMNESKAYMNKYYLGKAHALEELETFIDDEKYFYECLYNYKTFR